MKQCGGRSTLSSSRFLKAAEEGCTVPGQKELQGQEAKLWTWSLSFSEDLRTLKTPGELQADGRQSQPNRDPRAGGSPVRQTGLPVVSEPTILPQAPKA